MFSYFKEKISQLFGSFKSAFSKIFSSGQFGEQELKELFELLIRSEVGATNAQKLIDKIKLEMDLGKVAKPEQIAKMLEDDLCAILDANKVKTYAPEIIVLVGINGTGKTTSAAKLAAYYQSQNKKVLLVAADTFRAAAVDQLAFWAQKLSIDIVKPTQPEQDPVSVVFEGCKQFCQSDYDHLIIDTAGRLHTKINLMTELAKLYKVISKFCADKSVATWLTIDAMLGQSSINQAKVFVDATNVDGIILTKTDSAAKGGAVFAISQQFQVPVVFATFGEDLEQIAQFNNKEFVSKMFRQ